MSDEQLAESVNDAADFFEKEYHATSTAEVLRQAAKRLLERHEKNTP